MTVRQVVNHLADGPASLTVGSVELGVSQTLHSRAEIGRRCRDCGDGALAQGGCDGCGYFQFSNGKTRVHGQNSPCKMVRVKKKHKRMEIVWSIFGAEDLPPNWLARVASIDPRVTPVRSSVCGCSSTRLPRPQMLQSSVFVSRMAGRESNSGGEKANGECGNYRKRMCGAEGGDRLRAREPEAGGAGWTRAGRATFADHARGEFSGIS